MDRPQKPREFNAFDELGKNLRPLTEVEKKLQEEGHLLIDQLIFRTFYMNPDGKRLLEDIWEESLVNNPILRKGEAHDAYDIGYNQGMMDWIRFLKITVAQQLTLARS